MNLAISKQLFRRFGEFSVTRQEIAACRDMPIEGIATQY